MDLPTSWKASNLSALIESRPRSEVLKAYLALLPQNLWLLICRYIEKVLKIGAVAGHNTRDIEFSKVTNWTEMAVLCTITVTDFTIFNSSDKLK